MSALPLTDCRRLWRLSGLFEPKEGMDVDFIVEHLCVTDEDKQKAAKVLRFGEIVVFSDTRTHAWFVCSLSADFVRESQKLQSAYRFGRTLWVKKSSELSAAGLELCNRAIRGRDLEADARDTVEAFLTAHELLADPLRASLKEQFRSTVHLMLISGDKRDRVDTAVIVEPFVYELRLTRQMNELKRDRSVVGTLLSHPWSFAKMKLESALWVARHGEWPEGLIMATAREWLIERHGEAVTTAVQMRYAPDYVEMKADPDEFIHAVDAAEDDWRAFLEAVREPVVFVKELSSDIDPDEWFALMAQLEDVVDDSVDKK